MRSDRVANPPPLIPVRTQPSSHSQPFPLPRSQSQIISMRSPLVHRDCDSPPKPWPTVGFKIQRFEANRHPPAAWFLLIACHCLPFAFLCILSPLFGESLHCVAALSYFSPSAPPVFHCIDFPHTVVIFSAEYKG